MITMTQGCTTSVVFSLFLLIAILLKTSYGQGIIHSGRNCAEFEQCSSSGINIALNIAEDKTITFTDPYGTTALFRRTQKSAAAARKTARKRNGFDNTVSWHGLSDFRAANIISTGRGANITYTGSFVIEDRRCLLHYMNGEQVVKCKDLSKFPPRKDPKQQTNKNNDKEQSNSNRSNIFSHIDPLRTTSASSTIDTMVIWTKKAECALSDKSQFCSVNSSTKNTMEDLIDLAIEETNTAYTESGIQAQLRLVHAYRDDYVEKNNNAFDKALSHISNDDDIYNKRSQYNADVVALLVDDSQYCGLAWIGPGFWSMYSVTGWDCATGTYTFGHEVGHNMGCNHDRGTEGECNTSCYSNYNYGWRNPQGDWTTIMSYSCERGQCDNNPSSWCGEIQRFSSRTVTFQGKSLGNQYTDCSRQHNDVRTQVENYFTGSPPTPTPPTPTPPTPTPPTPTPPTPTPPSSCEDSTRKFLVNFRDRTCDWVSKTGTAKRCQKGGGAVATHCPKTCGTCDNCVDAKKRFYLKTGNLKSCEWVARTNSAKKCKKIGDDSTCRFTCGNC